jgi:hypothetical protein
VPKRSISLKLANRQGNNPKPGNEYDDVTALATALPRTAFQSVLLPYHESVERR